MAEIRIVRRLMRDARSSPSATNLRTVDRAHWSFALTCATESNLETGMFPLLDFDLKEGEYGQNVARSIISLLTRDLTGGLGQERFDRFGGRKSLKRWSES